MLRLLGRSMPRRGFSASGELSHESSGYTLILETSSDGHPGFRRMHDASCEALAHAAAAVIALAIDPTLQLPGTESTDIEPVPVAEKTPIPGTDGSSRKPVEQPPAGAARPAEPKPTPPAAAFEIDALLMVVGETGTVPGFAPGGMVLVEARKAYALLGIGAEYLLPQRTTLPDSAVGALIAYSGVKAIGCVGPFDEQFAPAGCAGFGFGRLTGESRGASTPGYGSMRWFTPELGGLLRYRASERLFLQASGTLRIALEDSEFTIENVGPIYSPDWVALALHAGVAVRIW